MFLVNLAEVYTTLVALWYYFIQNERWNVHMHFEYQEYQHILLQEMEIYLFYTIHKRI